MISPSLTPNCIAVSTPLASILMTRFILGLLQKSARNAGADVDATTGARVSTYPRPVRAFAWMLLVLDGVAAVGIAIYQGNHGASLEGMLLGAAMFAVLAAVVAEFTQVRVEWTDAAVSIASPWAAPRRLSWSDIVQVTYSANARWFVVRGRDGTKIRLAYLLGGLRELLDEMKRRGSDEVRGQIEVAMRTEFPG